MNECPRFSVQSVDRSLCPGPKQSLFRAVNQRLVGLEQTTQTKVLRAQACRVRCRQIVLGRSDCGAAKEQANRLQNGMGSLKRTWHGGGLGVS